MASFRCKWENGRSNRTYLGVSLEQFDMHELALESGFIRENDSKSAFARGAGGGSGDDWWAAGAGAGVSLAMDIATRIEGYGGQTVVCMEDFVLSPTKSEAGMGGRNAITPVVIGGALWATLGSCFSSPEDDLVGGLQRVSMVISSPSAKSVIGSKPGGVIPKMFGDQWVEGVRGGRGMPHAVDAMRHAILGFRAWRKG